MRGPGHLLACYGLVAILLAITAPVMQADDGWFVVVASPHSEDPASARAAAERAAASIVVGVNSDAFGGGGGSGYLHPTLMGGMLLGGMGGTPGNSASADRMGAGAPAAPGAVLLDCL